MRLRWFNGWELMLPTRFTKTERLLGMKVLGFGVLWDRRPGRVRALHWTHPRWDNQERLKLLIDEVNRQRKLAALRGDSRPVVNGLPNTMNAGQGE